MRERSRLVTGWGEKFESNDQSIHVGWGKEEGVCDRGSEHERSDAIKQARPAVERCFIG